MSELVTRTSSRPWWAALGPGLLWAGTAIGVSHLVQSTRAGAGYGLTLLWVVLLANFLKYPGYEAGSRYTAATGHSLVEGYRRLGTWVLVVVLGLTLSTMLTVLAAVTLVAAGLASALVTDALPVWIWSALLLLGSAALLAFGRFRLLERVMTALMLLLAVSTVVAAAVAVPSTDWAAIAPAGWLPELTPTNLVFLVALVGWMPSAYDTALWHSLWMLDKANTEQRALDEREAFFDFNVGYLGTAILAALFVFLGATTLFGQQVELPRSGAGFAAMLVDVYATTLGTWARPVILVAAFTTMLSTTLAVSDGFPRALEGLARRFVGPEVGPEPRGWIYWVAIAGCGLGAQVLITFFASAFAALIDLATILTSLTAPFLAGINLLLLRSEAMPDASRPSPLYTAYHLAGLVFLTGMAGLYLVVRFGG